jgi:hypothetical protein
MLPKEYGLSDQSEGMDFLKLSQPMLFCPADIFCALSTLEKIPMYFIFKEQIAQVQMRFICKRTLLTHLIVRCMVLPLGYAVSLKTELHLLI